MLTTNNNTDLNISDLSNKFNLHELIKFFSKNGLLTTALIAVLTYRLMELSGEFFTGLVHPLFNLPFTDKKNRQVRLEDLEINIGTFKFKLGKIFFAVLKTALVLYLIWLVLYLSKKLVK